MKRLSALIVLFASGLALANKTPIDIPETDTAIGFAGKIHVDVIVNHDDMGNETGFSPATIPTTGNSGNLQSTLSAGQSKFQFFTSTDVDRDSVDTLIEWDWFNTDNSSDIHLTQIWAEYKGLGGGQTFSVFMDISTFPNTLEYWGPNSMVFVRQPQVRYTMQFGDGQRLAFAVEKPNAAVEGVGPVCAGGITCENYDSLPDLTGHWRIESESWHLQVAGILRRVGYQYNNDQVETTMGYGVNVTSNWQFTDSSKLSAAFTAGKGIGRYINDTSFSDSDAVIKANGDVEAIPVLGFFAFVEQGWTEKMSSSFGLGHLRVDNDNAQAGAAFKQSNFVVANLLYQLAEPITVGTELQWGDYKDNNRDSGDNLRWQSSIIYRF